MSTPSGSQPFCVTAWPTPHESIYAFAAAPLQLGDDSMRLSHLLDCECTA